MDISFNQTAGLCALCFLEQVPYSIQNQALEVYYTDYCLALILSYWLSSSFMYSQVDQLFGRDHLFKRSIILVKAWCYYESRILGANTGLISTYALAVLVLYIINLFHSSLSGPLAVITLFLKLLYRLL